MDRPGSLRQATSAKKTHKSRARGVVTRWHNGGKKLIQRTVYIGGGMGNSKSGAVAAIDTLTAILLIDRAKKLLKVGDGVVDDLFDLDGAQFQL